MNVRPGGYRRARKIRDRSLVLLLIAMLLLMPPVAPLFHVDSKLFGLPATLIYVFALWALLILGARLLAKPLQRTTEQADTTR